MVVEDMKQYKKEYWQKWYPKNKEKRKAYLKEYCKEYYIKNKEKIIKNVKENYRKNPEIVKERVKRWEKENVEKYRANKRRNVKLYNKRYPEKVKIRAKLYRLINKGLLPHPKTLKCILCDKQAEQYHHPDYKNFQNDVMPICIKCHSLIHNGGNQN